MDLHPYDIKHHDITRHDKVILQTMKIFRPYMPINLS
jgi:hypothetical protein